MKRVDLSAAREGFFFYLLENKKDKQELLTGQLKIRGVRKTIISEITDVILLLTDESNHPRFARAVNYWVHRLTLNHYPRSLMTDIGIQEYQNYLTLTANPTIPELEEVLNKYGKRE